MWPFKCGNRGEWILKIISFAKALTIFTAGSLFVEPVLAGGTVTSCTESSLRAAMAGGAPATDQRGIARPQGPGVDIGAFEYQYIPVFAHANLQGATNCLLRMAGLLPNQTFTVQASSNLINWSTVTSFTAGTNGLFQLTDPMPGNWPARFYRLQLGAP
jgi:hypothetical protein